MNVIESLRELTKRQMRAVLENAEIHIEVSHTPPVYDVESIKARAAQLDPTSQTKADIYCLLHEIKRLNKLLAEK